MLFWSRTRIQDLCQQNCPSIPWIIFCECNNIVTSLTDIHLCVYFSQMVGVEYILLHAQEPILYIIRKQQRQSPTQVIPLSDYYIIAGVVYQAPDLGTVIGSRVVRES
ncbi:unnamed protein product [Oncorhynchus mykiss]|uniref:Mediator of RNA polymerase II transcription subunit 6 n=1 Tax=Oncorhynchus mykiss TaxID=8022 RepID=A0A060ZFU3_ONCMY|nr:unnamed protein product [Oncorhynchus mykiss]